MLRKYFLNSLCIVSLISTNVFGLDLREDTAQVYLSRLATVTNTGGDNYDLSAISPEESREAWDLSNAHFSCGFPDFFKSNDFLLNITKNRADVQKLASGLSHLLSQERTLESLRGESFLTGADANNRSQLFNIIINNFCWDKGKNITTEVTKGEVEALLLTRQRVINFKKSF